MTTQQPTGQPEDEVQGTVNAMEALLDRMEHRDSNDPNRKTFTFDEDGNLEPADGPEA